MISQADGARLMFAAKRWVDRAVAVYAGKRPCDVKEYEKKFTELVSTLIDEKDR